MGNEAAAQKKKETEFKQEKPVHDSVQLSRTLTGVRWKIQGGAPPEKMAELKKQADELEHELNDLLKNRVLSSTPKPLQAPTPVEKAAPLSNVVVKTQETVAAIMKKGVTGYQHNGDIPNLFLKQVAAPTYA